IAAAQEERFTRKKYDARFPFEAINYCLEEASIDAKDLDAVIYYDNPTTTVDRVFKNAIATAHAGLEQWTKACTSLLGAKARVKEKIKKYLSPEIKILFANHHLAHAASAFYPSPFSDAAILTADGVGEWATTTIGIGNDRRVQLLKEIRYPHSLGLL